MLAQQQNDSATWRDHAQRVVRAAYYDEYMPADLQPGRLEKDVSLMKEAGISVVRMGESTWSLWEPADGQFEYAWMDRIVDAMG